ncbi:MAG: YihY/virulence factor BrkB family protein [Streptosporangiales bacterium]|nr:YihY/virulence factor BrkB family protein [Streptosporangiales bacterium]
MSCAPRACRGGAGSGRVRRPEPLTLMLVTAPPATPEDGGLPRPSGVLGVARALLVRTTLAAFQQRLTGLAAEAAFFTLLSLPPLVLGLIGTLGWFRPALGEFTVGEIRFWVVETSGTVLTDSVVQRVVVPLLDDVLSGGRAAIVSIGFVISLWSGSRAMNVYVDTITVAYGLDGLRGVIRTRLLSFALYLVWIALGLGAIPLLVAGPTLLVDLVPDLANPVRVLYWPVVSLVSIVFLTLLYSAAVPVRTPWWRDLPGAVLALVIWILGSFALRVYLGVSLSGLSIYGSLAAPIAILAWLYVTAFAVLAGAGLNAQIDLLWPTRVTAEARRRLSAGDQG